MEEIIKIVNEHMEEMADKGTLEKLIKACTEKAVTEAIKMQFNSFASIGNQIHHLIKTGLQLDPSAITFDIYNMQMMSWINATMKDFFMKNAKELFNESMKKIFEPVPSSIDVSDLIEKIVSFYVEDDPYLCEDLLDYADVRLEKKDVSLGYTLEIFIKERDTLPRIRLYISTNEKGEYVIRIDHNLRYNPTYLLDVEGYIFKLFSAQTVITGLESFNIDDHEYPLKVCEED